ncbi:uncharacterized protein RAG0_08036 [Rhynchosporium agropyri]|uniref:Uncharacterized protein n=1 Tax=Rhynchosporium agropyri TaxID=914238 RepID=A0A1E1KNX9_9HELO|nr:uncharacterized protein RAG0_08036 [Rhynchosporium agropyri]
MSIESRVTNTGATSSSISAMELDLVGPEGAFGRVNLPVIKTNSAGVDVNIASQTIKITDKTAFKAFVTAVLRNEDLVLQLKNGKGTVKAMLGLSAKIDYNKDCALKGMNGPKTSIVKTEVLGGQRYRSTMRVINPSPLELDLGTIKQEIRNLDGSVIAVQQGKMYLLRGESEYVVEGMVVGKAVGKDVKLVATGVEEDNWHNETITAFDEPIVLTNELLNICNNGGEAPGHCLSATKSPVAPYTPKSELEDSSLRFLTHHYVTGFVDRTVTCPGIRREWYLLAFRDPAFFNAVLSWTISHAAYFQQIKLLRNFHVLRGVAIQLVGKRIRNGAHDEGTINAVVVFAQQKLMLLVDLTQGYLAITHDETSPSKLSIRRLPRKPLRPSVATKSYAKTFAKTLHNFTGSSLLENCKHCFLGITHVTELLEAFHKGTEMLSTPRATDMRFTDRAEFWNDSSTACGIDLFFFAQQATKILITREDSESRWGYRCFEKSFVA